jgi:hypothetical protein
MKNDQAWSYMVDYLANTGGIRTAPAALDIAGTCASECGKVTTSRTYKNLTNPVKN